jgi:hypothetical protein
MDETLVARRIQGHIPAAVRQREELEISVGDDPGPDGVCSRYDIVNVDFEKHPAYEGRHGYGSGRGRLVVLFQQGDPDEVGLNGVTEEALLAIVVDRLKSQCDNAEAAHLSGILTTLQHCEIALRRLRPRPTLVDELPEDIQQ